jgi:hypothetical protein
MILKTFFFTIFITLAFTSNLQTQNYPISLFDPNTCAQEKCPTQYD